MYLLAYGCILLSLLVSLGAGGMALLQLWQQRINYLKGIKNAHWLVTGGLTLAAALLLHALFWEDYQLEYVASYTDSVLPLFYRLTAFWAGQPGSMLFWTWCCAIAGLIYMLSGRGGGANPRTALWYWVFFYANIAFFCLILTSWSNPFIMLSPAPVDGQGLNPLLQNPGMIFHPPLLFMGYAIFIVPACLALAQCVAPENERPWYRVTRPYILIAWMLLTAGIILGAWWAYMELGWGGYWAWDPVENASLLPWLTASACLHLLAIRNASGKLPRATAFLMSMTIITAIFATYLTRSGVIQSVHAFGDGGVGTPLLAYIFASLVFSIWAVFSTPQNALALAAPVSREGALLLSAWIFIALAIIITIATMWPVFSQLLGKHAMGLDASFYNKVCLPLATALLVILCICGWIGWSGGIGSTRKFYATCGAFIASIAALWVSGYRQPLPLIAASAAIAAICALCMHLTSGALWRNSRALSAWGAHFGLALLALGVAFSASYTVERELMLARGQEEKVGPYTVTLTEVGDGSNAGYDFLRANLKISFDGREVGILKPERRIYAKFGDMQFSEVDVISSLAEDIYASLLGMDEDYKVLVKISLEPLVNWIWIGGSLMCLLPLLGFLAAGRSASVSRN